MSEIPQEQTGTSRLAVIPDDSAARGRSIRIAPGIWDQVAARCRAEESRPSSYAWSHIGAAYALGLIDLPDGLPHELLTSEKPQSKSLRLPDWVWDEVTARYARERKGRGYNPWVLLGAAYGLGLIDLPRTALVYPPQTEG